MCHPWTTNYLFKETQIFPNPNQTNTNWIKHQLQTKYLNIKHKKILKMKFFKCTNTAQDCNSLYILQVEASSHSNNNSNCTRKVQALSFGSQNITVLVSSIFNTKSRFLHYYYISKLKHQKKGCLSSCRPQFQSQIFSKSNNEYIKLLIVSLWTYLWFTLYYLPNR